MPNPNLDEYESNLDNLTRWYMPPNDKQKKKEREEAKIKKLKLKWRNLK